MALAMAQVEKCARTVVCTALGPNCFCKSRIRSRRSKHPGIGINVFRYHSQFIHGPFNRNGLHIGPHRLLFSFSGQGFRHHITVVFRSRRRGIVRSWRLKIVIDASIAHGGRCRHRIRALRARVLRKLSGQFSAWLLSFSLPGSLLKRCHGERDFKTRLLALIARTTAKLCVMA
jgi:hypothetical protein